MLPAIGKCLQSRLDREPRHVLIVDAAGEWEGWEYDLLMALCAEMNEKCTLIAVAWDGIIPALLEKKMDGIFGSMSITEERDKVIDFTQDYIPPSPSLFDAPSSRTFTLTALSTFTFWKKIEESLNEILRLFCIGWEYEFAIAIHDLADLCDVLLLWIYSTRFLAQFDR